MSKIYLNSVHVSSSIANNSSTNAVNTYDLIGRIPNDAKFVIFQMRGVNAAANHNIEQMVIPAQLDDLPMLTNAPTFVTGQRKSVYFISMYHTGSNGGHNSLSFLSGSSKVNIEGAQLFLYRYTNYLAVSVISGTKAYRIMTSSYPGYFDAWFFH